ncbi:MAG: hypothetical protein A3G81_18210 [Betaproteobacteria bacterium RIFCSPLOWO2_12_FULL_65_14]|nr:MAG: hypothetical protein A3G81_18210 [Betaproteobacteria bacterium RIFCSPLOWO2_12_FULL_65_14]
MSAVPVSRDTVVSLRIEIYDAQGYTVTGMADGSVVLDANHPLAGMALRFVCSVTSVRPATEEELARGVSLP